MRLSTLDRKMLNKGYVYKLTPINDSIPALYAKNVNDVKLWLQEYKNTRFNIEYLPPQPSKRRNNAKCSQKKEGVELDIAMSKIRRNKQYPTL